MGEMQELQATVIYAYDWTMLAEQIRQEDIQAVDCLQIYVVGFVTYEDEEFVCLSQQVFNEARPNIRFTVIIPKVCIIERQDLKFNPDPEEEESEEDLVIEE